MNSTTIRRSSPNISTRNWTSACSRRELEGVQSILWRYIENEIEGATFRLNDIYWKENMPAAEQLHFLRYKERKFGRGCIDQWRAQQNVWLKQLEQSSAAV